MSKAVAFARLSLADKSFAMEAAFFLLIAELLVRALPMRWWRRHVDTAHQPERNRGLEPAPVEHPRSRPSPGRVGRTVLAVSRALPVPVRCLAEAMATQWMLRRRGVASQLVFGVRRPESSQLRFHAWLCVDGRAVIGGGIASGFTPFPMPPAASPGGRQSEHGV